MAFERRVATSVVSLAKGKKRKENKDLYKKWNYDRTETLVKGVEVESIYFRAWSVFPSKNTLLVEKLKDFSENRISKVTKNGVEKYFSKSEERSE